MTKEEDLSKFQEAKDFKPPSMGTRLNEAGDIKRDFPNMIVMVQAEGETHEAIAHRTFKTVPRTVFDKSTHDASDSIVTQPGDIRIPKWYLKKT